MSELTYNDDFAYASEEQEETLSDILSEFLQDDEKELILRDIDKILDGKALEIAGEYIRRLALRLRSSPYGAALALALGIGSGETMREIGDDFCCSPQNIAVLREKCEEILENEKLPQRRARRNPVYPEGVISIFDAAKILGISRWLTRKKMDGFELKERGHYGAYLYLEKDVRNGK